MRRFASALAVASLLGCSLAFAQAAAPPGNAGTQAAPPPSSTSGESTGAAQQPSESGEHATSGKHMSHKACSKQAKTKQLKGEERKQFIKDCEAGKSTD